MKCLITISRAVRHMQIFPLLEKNYNPSVGSHMLQPNKCQDYRQDMDRLPVAGDKLPQLFSVCIGEALFIHGNQ